MAFHPQPQALFSPPPTPPMAMGPLMSLVHAVDVIKEEEYKVVVGREGATLNGIRSCSQVNVKPPNFTPYLSTGKHNDPREEGPWKDCNWKREQLLSWEGGGGGSGEQPWQ